MTCGERVGMFCMQHGSGAKMPMAVSLRLGPNRFPPWCPAGHPSALAHVQPNYNPTVKMAGITKSAEPRMAPGEVAPVMRRASNALRNGRRRPALVELPIDIAGEEMAAPPDCTPVAHAARLTLMALVGACRSRIGGTPRDRSGVAAEIADVEAKWLASAWILKPRCACRSCRFCSTIMGNRCHANSDRQISRRGYRRRLRCLRQGARRAMASGSYQSRIFKPEIARGIAAMERG